MYAEDGTISKFKFKERPQTIFLILLREKKKNLISKGSTRFPEGVNQPSRWVSNEGNPCSIINIFNN